MSRLSAGKIEYWRVRMAHVDRQAHAGAMDIREARAIGGDRHAAAVDREIIPGRSHLGNQVFANIGQVREHSMAEPHLVAGAPRPFQPLLSIAAAQRFQRLRSEEHTSELQSQSNLVCRLLLEKKKK